MPHHSYSLLFVNVKVPLVKVLELGVPTKVSLKGAPEHWKVSAHHPSPHFLCEEASWKHIPESCETGRPGGVPTVFPEAQFRTTSDLVKTFKLLCLLLAASSMYNEF